MALLALRQDGAADLHRRGLTDEDIALVGYRSLPLVEDKGRFLLTLVDRFGEAKLRLCPGFVNRHGQTDFWTSGRTPAGFCDGYIIPYRHEEAFITGLQVRWSDGKYQTVRNSQTAEIYHVAGHPAPGEELYITEGGLKAQVAHRLGGVVVVGVPGQSLSQKHIAVIRRLEPSRVIEALDQENNKNTELARVRWLHGLVEARLETYRAVWEGADVGGPKGIDDLFAEGGRPRLRAVHFVPSETGEKRRVRETANKGEIKLGLSLADARRLTQRGIEEFVASRRWR